MAIWTPATTKPERSGKVRCRCGVTGGAFWARWHGKLKRFTDLTGEPIVFGARDVPGDMWRIPRKPACVPHKTANAKNKGAAQ